ncbi:unnamed protein product [Oreochromis niloticus]|nr:unnamed protein product [Mustela putorius furo]
MAPEILKVILGHNSSQRLTFHCGLPGSVIELIEEVQRQCGLNNSNFRLQFMDPLFGNEFMNLTSMDEIQDRGTIRMTSLAVGLTTQSAEAHFISADAVCSFGLDDSTSRSSGCVDTDILSSPELEASCSSTSRALWPRVFCVPEFSFDAELKLERGNAAYKEKGTLLTSEPELKSQILEGLIQEIVRYKIYVSDKDLNTVDSLETLRVELLSDVKKANNREVVRMKMEKTFAYRRHEVVCDTPIISDFQARWSALFEVSEINAEFKPITTMPLQSRFLSQIDVLSDKLMKVFKTRGGQIGRRLQNILEPMAQDDVDLVRECIIKGLCVYLNEDPNNLVTEYVATDEGVIQQSIEETTMGIYIIKSREALRTSG